MNIKQCLLAGLFLLTITLCLACSSKIVRGQAPIIRVSELSHGNGEISLQLNIRNLNGVALDIQAIDFRLSVDEQVLIDYQGPSSTNITANGTEVREISVPENEAAGALLDQLQKGEFKSLPYALKGKVNTTGDGSLRFNNEGHIYPVPGRPGHFR